MKTLMAKAPSTASPGWSAWSVPGAVNKYGRPVVVLMAVDGYERLKFLR